MANRRSMANRDSYDYDRDLEGGTRLGSAIINGVLLVLFVAALAALLSWWGVL